MARKKDIAKYVYPAVFTVEKGDVYTVKKESWVRCSRLFYISLSEDGYHKNMPDLYEMLESIDGIHTAIGNAKRRMSEFIKGRDKPSECRPGTTVYVLVEELMKYLE